MVSTERYRLVRTVANGGMAQVVEAVACGLDGLERRVAIKRLLPQHADDGERRRMFLQEARLGSQLHHGGIVPIFDYGSIDGSEFLAMDFVDGLDALRAVTGANAEISPMPEGLALHVAAEVADALAYIHGARDAGGKSLGIIHRDVSPANILLSWEGDVKLCDFGIAFSGSRSPDEPTLGGAVKGKLHYMAPEQARGQQVTAAADVYALGATLDALLGGGAPAPVSSDDSGDYRAAEALRRGLSPAVSELIRACISIDPTTRPSAAEVAVRARALSGERLSSDGRTALVAWLQPLRARAIRQSKLDDLMGLGLVSVGPPEARTLSATTLDPSMTPREPPFAPVPARSAFSRRARTVAMTGGLALAAVLMGLGAGRFINQLRGQGAIAAPLPNIASAPSAPGAPSRGVAALAAPASPPAAPVSPSFEPRRSLIEPASRDELQHLQRHVEPASPFPGGPAHGWLRVGGRTLAGARVNIDHASAGFAPLEVELPTGVHTVTVTSPDTDRVLIERSVRITDTRTRLAPVRILR